MASDAGLLNVGTRTSTAVAIKRSGTKVGLRHTSSSHDSRSIKQAEAPLQVRILGSSVEIVLRANATQSEQAGVTTRAEDPTGSSFLLYRCNRKSRNSSIRVTPARLDFK